MNPFRPSSAAVGYPPLEDLGLIGDGATAALVARDGSIPWLCVPRFDSPPLLCGLLDAERGGRFVVAPEGLVESRQRYEADIAVLVTELRSEQGRIALTDLLTLDAGADASGLPAGASCCASRGRSRALSASASSSSPAAAPASSATESFAAMSGPSSS